MTWSVIRCSSGWAANTRSRGQLATARSVTSAIASPYSCMRSPWNGGSISRLRSRCDSRSSTKCVRVPATGPKASAFASPACISSAGAVKSAFRSAGVVSITSVGSPARWIVKVGPWVSTCSWKNSSGRVRKRAVWTKDGLRGPGGGVGMEATL